MHTKATSAAIAAVATTGFALAAFIPAASAQKSGHNTYTQYCENGTNTVYSEYNQYCEPTKSTPGGTPSTPGSTPVSTSPGTTPISTPPTTATTTTTTAVPDLAIGSVVAGVFTATKNMKVGTYLAPGVFIKSNHDGTLVIDSHGLLITVAAGDSFTVFEDGTVFVASTPGLKKVTKTKHAVSADVSTAKPALKAGEVAGYIANGGKAKTYFLRTALGVSFGPKTSKAQILKNVTFYNATKKDAAVIFGVSPFHGQIFGTLATATPRPVLLIAPGSLKLTASRAKYVKAHKVTTTSVDYSVATTAGKTYSLNFKVPLS